MTMITNKYHSILDCYFSIKPLYHDEAKKKPNVRKIVEQPYQQTLGEKWDALENTLTDLSFIEAKCRAGMTYKLIADYKFGLDHIPETQIDRQKEMNQEDRVKKYVDNLIAYSKREILTLDIISSVESIIEKPNNEDTFRMFESPSLSGRLNDFSLFVSQQCHSLLKYSCYPGFTIQQAYNYSGSGFIKTAAEEIIKSTNDVFLLMDRSSRHTVNDLHISPLMTLEGHLNSVQSVSITADGKRAISGSIDNTLRLWDIESGECLQIFRDAGWINCVCITPDGKRAISGSTDNTLRLWDLENGQCLIILEGHNGSVTSICLTPDGSKAISGSADGTLRLWDLKSWQCLKILAGHRGSVCSVCITPNGTRAVAGSIDMTMQLWNLEKGMCLNTFGNQIELVRNTQSIPQSKFLYIPPEGQPQLSDDLSSPAQDDIFNQLQLIGTQNHISITPDGKRVISGCADNSLKLWNPESGECLLTLKNQKGSVKGVCLTPDGKRAISANSDNILLLWDLENGQCLNILDGHTELVSCVSMTPDARWAVSGSIDRTIRIWDLKRAEGKSISLGHKGLVNMIAVVPGGRWAISASVDNTLRVWDLDQRECLQTLVGHNDSVSSVSVTSDGRRFISGSFDGTIRIWDLGSEECLGIIKNAGPVFSVSIAPDGRKVVSSDGIAIRLWDLESRECLSAIEDNTGSLWRINLTPDGRRAVTGSIGSNHNLRLWNLDSGECLMTLTGHTSSVNAVSIGPNGKIAVSGSQDQTLRVWNLESGICQRTIVGHTDAIIDVGITPDGRMAISASADYSLRIWDMESGTCLAIFQAMSSVCSISIASNNRLVCGLGSGEVIPLTLSNLSIDIPYVTPSRIWLYERFENKARWEDQVNTTCPWCGKRFPVASEILDEILAINQDAGITPDQSPCLTLPAKAWDEKILISECTFCHKTLRFNPFIVDNSGNFHTHSPNPSDRRPDFSHLVEDVPKNEISCPICGLSNGVVRDNFSRQLFRTLRQIVFICIGIALPFKSLWWLLISVPLIFGNGLNFLGMRNKTFYKCNSCNFHFSK
jgi:WD40 repeat protein